MVQNNSKNGWKTCYTLGAKAKSFCWKLDSDVKSIHIKRQFENVIKEERKEISEDELYKIHTYVWGRPQTDLANNVEKLRLGTEKEGLGKFLYDELGWSTTDAQLASHIAAIFVEAGAWTKNEAQRGMKFKVNAVDWNPCVSAYYRGSPNCTMTN